MTRAPDTKHFLILRILASCLLYNVTHHTCSDSIEIFWEHPDLPSMTPAMNQLMVALARQLLSQTSAHSDTIDEDIEAVGNSIFEQLDL